MPANTALMCEPGGRFDQAAGSDRPLPAVLWLAMFPSGFSIDGLDSFRYKVGGSTSRELSTQEVNSCLGR